MSSTTTSGTKADAHYAVRADSTTNRLYLTLAGTLTAEEIEQAAAETIAAAEQLDDGFAIVNDISAFTPPSPEAAKPIKQTQQRLKEMGLGDVVRVVADDTSFVTENAFQRRSREAGYDGKTASTVAAAEEQLE